MALSMREFSITKTSVRIKLKDIKVNSIVLFLAAVKYYERVSDDFTQDQKDVEEDSAVDW